jgi:hypothetical protein
MFEPYEVFFMDSKDFAEVVESRNRYTFKVSYNGTSANVSIHEKFKDFAERETDGVYILAIQKLLEAYEADWKYQSLFNEVQDLKVAYEELKVVDKNKEEKELKTFG